MSWLARTSSATMPASMGEWLPSGTILRSLFGSTWCSSQAEIIGQEKEITQLQQQLSQQELSLSPDRRSTMERDIQSKLLHLQSAREVASRELQIEVTAAQNSFEQKLMLAVERFGEEQGFTLVLTRDLVAFSSGTIDVTDQVIQRFDEMFPVTETTAITIM